MILMNPLNTVAQTRHENNIVEEEELKFSAVKKRVADSEICCPVAGRAVQSGPQRHVLGGDATECQEYRLCRDGEH